MNNFTDGAPRNPKQWINIGKNLVPLYDGKPVVLGWQDKTLKLSDFKGIFQYGLRLDEDTDFDIDNHHLKKFVSRYLKTNGAVFGRKSNLSSHYLFSGCNQYKKFDVPKELETHFKHFQHGICLCEIRSGHNRFTIVPDSISMRSKTEYVEWENFSGIKEYAGDLVADIGKIALSGALSILYPSKGARDNYCTAIAGVLSNHTNWDENEINEFVHNLSFFSKDENHHKKMSKGTNAKKSIGNKLGMPTISEIVGCSVQTIAKLFSWVGVKDSGSLFTELKVFNTEPTYWKIKYKNTWLTIYDSSHLLSYTKMSVHILEKCYEMPPVIKPKDWKIIMTDLLRNKKIIKVDPSHSYYGQIGSIINDYLGRDSNFAKDENGAFNSQKSYLKSSWGLWYNEEDNHIYFRLASIITKIKDARLQFETRKLTTYLREQYGADDLTLSIDGKDYRVWKVPRDEVEKRTEKLKVKSMEHKKSDMYERDSEKKYIHQKAWEKNERIRMDQVRDEQIRKLQSDDEIPF